MRLEFWNNPLVVSAVRLKYRRNSPALMASVWVMVLMVLGGLLNHYAPQNNWPFAESYLTAILAIQFIVSGGIALFATSSSINAEVTTRTLDFQRIVSLSPQSILIGKMLGEPALGYLLAIASIPLAAICCGLGAVSPLVMVLLYVNLFTFMLMFAAIGLIHTLTPPTQTDGRQRSSGGGIVFLVIFLSQFLIQGGVHARNTPGIAEAMQLLTPIGTMMALWKGDPWSARVELWDLPVSSLVVVPLVQLAIAAWIVAAMSRRLKNPLDPMVTKWRGYVTVAVCDAIFAGICFARWRQGFDMVNLLYAYSLTHVILCVLLLFTLAPRRAAIVSWLWRRDTHQSRWRDLLLGERSEVGPAGVVLGLVGIAVLLLGLVVPVAAASPAAMQAGQGPSVDSAMFMKAFAEVSAVTIVLVVAAAVTHQLVLVAAEKGGQLLYIVLLLLANGGPPLIGALLQAQAVGVSQRASESIILFSPIAYFAMNMTRLSGQHAGTIGILALYGTIAVVSYTLLRLWLRGQARIVERKLQSMGVKNHG